MAKKKYKIPFIKNVDGVSMIEYTHVPEGTVEVGWGPTEWREPKKFWAELVLDGHYRGRSAVRVQVVNVKNGERYSMGFASFYDAVKKYGVYNNTICGTFKFEKRGQNYGVVVASEKDE